MSINSRLQYYLFISCHISLWSVFWRRRGCGCISTYISSFISRKL